MSMSNSGSSTTSNDDWMHLNIQVPYDDGYALLLLLREKLGFRQSEIDHCELSRDDEARVSWGAAPDPRTMRQREIRNLERVPYDMLTPLAQRRLAGLRMIEASLDHEEPTP